MFVAQAQVRNTINSSGLNGVREQVQKRCGGVGTSLSFGFLLDVSDLLSSLILPF